MKYIIAGPRRITTITPCVFDYLDELCHKHSDILIGDANGIDKAIQKYLSSITYSNVTVYATEGLARNNIGNWMIRNVEVNKKTKDFQYYAAKDLQMVKDADCGFLIWNGDSKGTLNSAFNLVCQKKPVSIYFTLEKRVVEICSFSDLQDIVSKGTPDAQKILSELKASIKPIQDEQLVLNFE
jgi:hypothetical protein